MLFQITIFDRKGVGSSLDPPFLILQKKPIVSELRDSSKEVGYPYSFLASKYFQTTIQSPQN
jgi:hypothetical protein